MCLSERTIMITCLKYTQLIMGDMQGTHDNRIIDLHSVLVIELQLAISETKATQAMNAPSGKAILGNSRQISSS